MTIRDEAWPPGTPCWVDLVVEDPAAAMSFYTELFGWEGHDAGPDAGGYTVCLLDGRPTAGIGPCPPGLGLTNVWTTYLATDDADRTAKQIKASGGSLMIEPFDVWDAGRMGVAVDPTGISFGLWQSKAHIGSAVVNEPGGLTWNECMSRDYEGAQDFYSDVFGFEFQERGDAVTFRYSLIRLDGSAVAGLGELSAQLPQEIAGHWMGYFATADCDATVGKAAELGAVSQVAPTETPSGRMAVIEGPQGETFAVITVVDAEPAPA